MSKLGKYGPTASLADGRNAESPSERFLRLFDESFEACSQKGARSIARDRALRRHREGDLDGACRDLLAAVEARTKREPGIEAELREMCGV